LTAFVELSVRPWSVREFSVERLPILDTAAQKLRPVRNGEIFRNRLWQKVPKLWMMPTQIVTAAVAVGANSRAQPDHLGDQFLPCQVGKIIVHRHHHADKKIEPANSLSAASLSEVTGLAVDSTIALSVGKHSCPLTGWQH
jgi:hypothetical protein